MYDFRQLSPADFEDLTRDLLQRHWNIYLEAFKTGRDDGIDLRFSAIPSKTTIVQCKHFVGSTVAKLASELRKVELPKVTRLSPKRYVLVTSLPLNPADKARLRQAIPYIRKNADILGAKDLNNLLGKYTEIETQHFKLWLSSTAVLQRVLHNADRVQTDFDVARVRRVIPLYVQTNNYSRAMKIIADHNFVIISGVPGIGKTTLADMLLFTHLEAGYQPIVLKSEIIEGRRHFNNEARQVFYFDDFLGETFLGNRFDFLGKKEDSAILDFMEMVMHSKHARLILTTREHILRHAFQISERFRRSENGLAEHRFVLQLHDYTLLDRGRILYNHVCFSDLPLKHKRALLKDGFYMEVLRHRNYNPRLVEWLSRFANIKAIPAGAYQREVRRILEHPEELWRLAFEQQISEASRSALLALYSLGGKARIEDLEKVWRVLHRHRANKYRFAASAEDWRRGLQDLEGGFLVFDNGTTGFVNPSVRDFLDATIISTTDHLEDLLSSCVLFRQIVSIWALIKSERAQGSQSALLRYTGPLIESAKNNLPKPFEIKLDFGKGSYGIREVDTRPEERLRTMVSIAAATGSEAAVNYIEAYSAELVAFWETHAPDYRPAVVLLRAINDAGMSHSTMLPVHHRLKGALLRALNHGAESDHIVAMIEYAEGAGEHLWSVEDQRLLIESARKYFDNDFDDELHAAVDNRDGGMLQGLVENVESIGTACHTTVAFYLDRINHRLAELHSDEPEQRSTREWKSATEGDVDVSQEAEVVRLFDGLLSP